MKKELNTTFIYILSITGLLCCCFGGLGFLLSGPAYLVAHNKVKDATQNPDNYEGNIMTEFEEKFAKRGMKIFKLTARFKETK
mgnify:CR=1 FL=1